MSPAWRASVSGCERFLWWRGEVLDGAGRRARGGRPGGRLPAIHTAGPGRFGVDDPVLCGWAGFVFAVVPSYRSVVGGRGGTTGSVHHVVAAFTGWSGRFD